MNALDSVFDWVLAASVRASVLVLAILFLQVVFRRWLSAGWRHLLWLPMVVVLVLPVLPSVPVGLFSGDEVLSVDRAEGLDGVENVESVTELPVVVEDPAKGEGNVFAVVWLVGFGLALVVGLAGHAMTMRRVRRGSCGAEPDLLEMLEVAAREAGLARAPRLVVSRAVESPAVSGFFRPVLLLPVGFPNGFEDREARLILAHECCHLKRLDLPVNWLCCFLQAMHWSNPLLWFAFARMRVDREAACDARVLSVQNGDCRAAYGEALLKLQGMMPPRSINLGFVGIFERSAELKSRIVGISEHRPVSAKGHFSGMVACGVLLLFGATRGEVAEGPEVVDGPQAAVVNDGPERITAKLREIMVPEISLKEATLDEAIGFLRARSVELDIKELDPAKKGVSFVVRKPRADAEGEAVAQYDPITLELKNVTLLQALLQVAKESGAVFKVDHLAVTFLPQGEPDMVPVAEAVPAAGGEVDAKLMAEANKIIIESVDFTNTTLREAVDEMNRKAKEAAKGKAVVLLAIDPKVNAEVVIKELRLRNVPLGVAAKYCAETTRLRLLSEGNVIRFAKW